MMCYNLYTKQLDSLFHRFILAPSKHTELTLNVPEIHPMTYGQGQEYHFLGHQS